MELRHCLDHYLGLHTQVSQSLPDLYLTLLHLVGVRDARTGYGIPGHEGWGLAAAENSSAVIAVAPGGVGHTSTVEGPYL